MKASREVRLSCRPRNEVRSIERVLGKGSGPTEAETSLQLAEHGGRLLWSAPGFCASLGQTFWFEGFAWGCVGAREFSCLSFEGFAHLPPLGGHLGVSLCWPWAVFVERVVKVGVWGLWLGEHAVFCWVILYRVHVYLVFWDSDSSDDVYLSTSRYPPQRKVGDIWRRLCWFLPLKFKSSFVASFVAFRWVEKTSDVFYGCVSGMDVLGIRQFIFALEIQVSFWAALMLSFWERQGTFLRRFTCFLLYYLSNSRNLQMIPPFKFQSFCFEKTWDILRWFLLWKFLSSTHPVRKHGINDLYFSSSSLLRRFM